MATKVAFVVLFIVLGMVASEPALAAGERDRVVHVYVIRRALSGQPITSIGAIAHSALLLKTEQGYYTLEYMQDGRAHLTPGKPKVVKVYANRRMATVAMPGREGDGSKVHVWERQLNGQPVKAKWTAEDLQSLMQTLMGRYDMVAQEHCHTAQERLRKAMGILGE